MHRSKGGFSTIYQRQLCGRRFADFAERVDSTFSGAKIVSKFNPPSPQTGKTHNLNAIVVVLM
jgi:hypothetical protein